MGASALRRGAAALLLVLAVLPVYRLLAGPAAGPAGAATLRQVSEYSAYLWSAALLLLAAAVLAAGVLPLQAGQRAGGAARALLLRLPERPFAAAAALLALLLAAYINRSVLYGEPNLIDAMSQLVHARYLAAGRLAGPATDHTAFWHMQQMLATPHGWVSQYPPAHAAVLALGFRLGRVELVGPIIFALTVFVTGRLAARLLPGHPGTARLGTLLLALSPFAAAHAAAYMNHTTAALFAVCAAWAAVRLSQGGGSAHAVTLGLALGALFATRPLTGLVVGALAALQVLAAFTPDRTRVPTRQLLVAAAAALPLIALLAAWNQHFFGAPWRFGYTVALGPDGGLGFGIDPWGNTYDVRAALGYTSAELAALSLFLLETPLPAVAVIALALLLAARLEAGERFLAAWALLPLAAHLCYWHHGLHMGPRMLNEYAPAWTLLAAVAARRLVAAAPARLGARERWSPRVALGAAFAGAWGFALVLGTPARLAGYRSPVLPVAYVAEQLSEPGVVFVHGAWGSRLAMQIAADGMRLDSLETLMRRNSTCRVQQWYDGAGDTGALDFDRAVSAALPQREVAPGSRIRVRAGEPWAPACAREAAADRFGVVEVTAYLWRGGLPGIDDDRTLLVRDLGPARNARLIRELGRTPWVFAADPRRGRLRLLPYDSAMARIWATPPAPVVAGGILNTLSGS